MDFWEKSCSRYQQKLFINIRRVVWSILCGVCDDVAGESKISKLLKWNDSERFYRKNLFFFFLGKVFRHANFHFIFFLPPLSFRIFSYLNLSFQDNALHGARFSPRFQYYFRWNIRFRFSATSIFRLPCCVNLLKIFMNMHILWQKYIFLLPSPVCDWAWSTLRYRQKGMVKKEYHNSQHKTYVECVELGWFFFML